MAEQGGSARAKEDKKKGAAAQVRRPKAIKRDIQNTKSRLRNRIVRSQVRTAIRHFEESLTKKDSSVIRQALDEAYSSLDKAVKKGVFTLNKGSRTKSRLAARMAAPAKA